MFLNHTPEATPAIYRTNFGGCVEVTIIDRNENIVAIVWEDGSFELVSRYNIEAEGIEDVTRFHA